MYLLHVVGARPNFMKAAPVFHALSSYPSVCQTLVHTGQHYDVDMSDVFFRQLRLPAPDFNLGIGAGSHAAQTAHVMMAFEQLLATEHPDAVIVYGDVNSTLGAALVCAKLGIPVVHVEAGLRSFDRTMPEEINRLLTDQLSTLLLTPSADGNANLEREGISKEKIHLVGNVMIDTLVTMLPQAEAKWADLRTALGVRAKAFGLVTLHRPSNVDEPRHLRAIMMTLAALSQELPMIFPVHPRTRRQLETLGLNSPADGVLITTPLGYLEFLCLQKYAAVVITDSGGVQEETTFLNTPCLTLRKNTERPVTVELGTNQLVGDDMCVLAAEIKKVLSGEGKQGKRPPLWDGQAAARIAALLISPAYHSSAVGRA